MSLTSRPHTRLDCPHAPLISSTPRHFFPSKGFNNFFLDISQVEQLRQKKRPPHLLWLFSWPFLYLAFQRWWSINRLWPHMPLLSSACMWGGGWVTVPHHTTSTTVTSSARLRLFRGLEWPSLAESEKVFQIISTAVRENVKVLTGGGGRSALETRDKIKWLVRADVFCSMFLGPNCPWCSTITKSGKGWIITWHLNCVQLSFTGLCTEQMLHLESLKILCYLNPFEMCKMRNTCSRINTSIKTKPDLFKSLSPAR